MLRSLRIRNLATIEDMEVSFEEGFSILTGETGAGKSIIIDGIKLLLGEKSSSDLIRSGKSEASVEAVFILPQRPRNDNLAAAEEDEIFIQRQVSVDGPGKAYVNGVLVPVKKVKETSAGIVDIYGQNDHVFLLHLENHLQYLDHHLKDPSLKEVIAGRAQELKRLIREKAELEEKRRERAMRLDFLAFQAEEIEMAGLRPGENEELAAERNILKNAEKITTLVDKAINAVTLQENSLISLLARLKPTLAELGRFDPQFAVFNESLAPVDINLRELADSLVKFQERQAAAPERLELLEERLNRIEKLMRKYGGNIADILAYLGKIQEERRTLVGSEDRLSELTERIDQKTNLYKESAEKLSRMRREAAAGLEKQIEEEIALLGMKKARFKIRIETIPLSCDFLETIRENGVDDVEFLISPNPGENLKPLRKIASGGELSRIMLALKTVGREKALMKTLIFDEIDSGIGGKTADLIAQKLRRLAERHQVICITHLPQIASFASHHFRVEKKVEKDRTYTTLKRLRFEERVPEISRLLSGSRITESSLKNAREMLLHNLGKEQD